MVKSSKNHIKDSVEWARKNRAKHRYYNYKSNARTFINKYATRKDLLAMLERIGKKLAK